MTKNMQIIIDVAYFLFFIFSLPFFIFKSITQGKYKKGILSRFGFYPTRLSKYSKQSPVIWLHSVSVGEAISAQNFIKSLKERLTSYKWVFSTVTDTAQEVVQHNWGNFSEVIYFPLDFSFSVKRAIDAINPSLVIVMETEIWPNLLISLSKRKIPVFFVNGRISDRSYKKYRIIKPVLKNVFKSVSGFFMQTDEDARRIIGIGADPEDVFVTGNIKFDSVDEMCFSSKTGYYKELFVLTHPLIVAGSTHRGEEEIILKAFKYIKEGFLILAPRHLERLKEVEDIITRYGYNPLRLSNFKKQTDLKHSIILLDTMGELRFLYGAADIAIVGGSFVPKGGHNILEPASFGIPVLFGKYTFNFKESVSIMLNSGAAIQINNKTELKTVIEKLLKDKQYAEQIGEKGKELILKNKGSSDKIADMIKKLL